MVKYFLESSDWKPIPLSVAKRNRADKRNNNPSISNRSNVRQVAYVVIAMDRAKEFTGKVLTRLLED